jgi:HSP20 family molecular chaperone IbpA
MFGSLIPWKKRNGNIAIRHDEPTRLQDRDYYPLVRFRDEFDSLMQRFFSDRWFGDRPLGNLANLWNEPRFETDLGWEDKGNEYVFHAELPGFEPEDFEVKVSGNVLTVRAEHKDQKTEKKSSSYSYGMFSRTFTLPYGADEEKIDARYHSGVLEVHLPKSAEAEGKRIEVKSA